VRDGYPERATLMMEIYITVTSCLLTISWIALVLYLWPMASAAEQAAMVCLMFGALCVGAITLITLPLSCTLWVLTMAVPISVRLLTSQGPVLVWIGVFAVVATVAIIFATRGVGRTFIQWMRNEAESAKQTSMASLLLQDFENDARDWLWETDGNGKLTHVSPRMAETLGTTIERLRGMPMQNFFEGVSADAQTGFSNDRNELQKRLSSWAPFRNCVVEAISPQGSRWFSLSAKPLFDADDDVLGWRGVAVDVTTERVRQEEMQRLANVDTLTGLANRYRLMRRLRGHFPVRSGGTRCALLLIDMDNFKVINDSFGHSSGDQLLRMFAEQLTLHVPKEHVLARLGGDEFAILLAGDVSKPRIEAVCEAVRTATANPFDIGGRMADVHVSIGVAFSGLDATDEESMLSASDMALYAAKSQGRNRTCYFDASMKKHADARSLLSQEIRAGLARDEFALHYQPVIDARDGAICGFEALLRWHHPRRGAVSPAEFIPIAEESGFIKELGHWVLNRACLDAAKWPSNLHVAVNISAIHFSADSLLPSINEALQKSNLAPNRLKIELTESALFSNPDTVLQAMTALRAQNIQLALDDYGTGYSSLAHLRAFPFSELKIDQSYIRVITENHKDAKEARIIVMGIVNLARAMGIEICAEGVEHADQLSYLRAVGCNRIQGFLVSKAIPYSAVADLLANQEKGPYRELFAKTQRVENVYSIEKRA
jgi:diguanylate cyclase (GGDEF)-like protein/PAS domain S-box-containing protein